MDNEVNSLNLEETLSHCIIPRENRTPPDDMLYGVTDFFNIPVNKAAELRFHAIKYAFDYHYSNNSFYRNFCQTEHVTPDDIREISDFDKIPKIPDTFFKDYPSMKSPEFSTWVSKTSAVELKKIDHKRNLVNDKLLDEIEFKTRGFVLHSSGTGGKFSILVRDRIGSFRWAYALSKSGFFSVVPPSAEANIVYLGPAQTHLAFGRVVFELPRIFKPSNIHFMSRKKLTMDMLAVLTGARKGLKESVQLFAMRLALARARSRIVKLLQRLDSERKQVFIIAPPYELHSIMTELKKQNIRLNLGNNGSVVLTAAGWKIFEHRRMTGQEFRTMAGETLGIPDKHCRDVYAMSEWHGLAWECEGHYKHIIQCTYPMVLDDKLEPSGYGKYGRFAFLDPLSHTFPGFIITGDRVKMLKQCPACHRSSPVLEPEITRMQDAENKGCGELTRLITKPDGRYHDDE